MALLQVNDVSKDFGGVRALNFVSLEVNEGEIVAIIGPNGAGKTTLVNCINKVYPFETGEIIYNGRDITKLPSHKVAGLGIARTFQNIALFKGMTVLENIMLGAHARMKTGVLSGGIYWGPARKREIEQRKKVEGIIDFLEMEHVRKSVVGPLAYGIQKRVEFGRALALDPRLIVLDECMAGMNLEEKEDMARFILDANEELDKTIVLIEHDMGFVMDISDRILVLEQGRKLTEGTPEEVRKNPDVIKAYLGGSAKA
ncbi:MAG: ABC transporter ATP-binding protein [Deltaproteobacteria bacterium]|nr:ABC transporter ATP-binding protein [Deltaproteobacteria bacterium]